MTLIENRFIEFFTRCNEAGLDMTFNRQGLSFLTGYTDDDIYSCLDSLQEKGKITFTMNSLNYTITVIS